MFNASLCHIFFAFSIHSATLSVVQQLTKLFMSQKCVKCGVPLEGFMAKIAGFMGVKKSEKNPDCCNKCEDHVGGEAPVTDNSANAGNTEDHSGHDHSGGSCCH